MPGGEQQAARHGAAINLCKTAAFREAGGPSSVLQRAPVAPASSGECVQVVHSGCSVGSRARRRGTLYPALQGGELFTRLLELKILDEDTTRFYGAHICVVYLSCLPRSNANSGAGAGSS